MTAEKTKFTWFLDYLNGISTGIFLLYLLITPLFWFDDFRRIPEWFNMGAIFLGSFAFVKIVSVLSYVSYREDEHVSKLLYTMFIIYAWIYYTNISDDKSFEDMYQPLSDYQEMSLSVRRRNINSKDIVLYNWIIAIGIVSCLAIHSTIEKYQNYGILGLGFFTILLGFANVITQDFQLPWIYYLSKFELINPNTLTMMNVKFLENSEKTGKHGNDIALTQGLARALLIIGLLLVFAGVTIIAQLYYGENGSIFGGNGKNIAAVNTAGRGALSRAQLERMQAMQSNTKKENIKEKKMKKENAHKRHVVLAQIGMILMLCLFLPMVFYELEMLTKARVKREIEKSSLGNAELEKSSLILLQRHLQYVYPISFQILKFLNMLVILSGILHHLIQLVKLNLKIANNNQNKNPSSSLPGTPPLSAVNNSSSSSEEKYIHETTFMGLKPNQQMMSNSSNQNKLKQRNKKKGSLK